MPRTLETIGFVGTGRMGRPIAANLLEDGHELTVHNRTREKAEDLQAQGATLVETPRDAAEGADLVVTMVSDDEAVEAVTYGPEGVLEGLGGDAIHVIASTISPETSRSLAPDHEDTDAHYLAGPVFGRPDAAAARQLWWLLSGPEEPRKRARRVLEPLGQDVYGLGEDPGAANVVKLSGNFLIASAIETMGEAFAFAEKQGIRRGKIAKILRETLFGGLIYTNYGKAIASHDYEPGGFSLEHGYKDVRLTVDSAREVEVPMPVASLLHDRYLSELARGRGELDWAALARRAAEDAGLEVDD